MYASLLLTFYVTLLLLPPAASQAQHGDAGEEAVFLIPQRNLEQLRVYWQSGTPAQRSVLQQLVERAEGEIGTPPYTIVHKTVLPPSGDPHDYLSLAPYWWPNPNTDDGLPWVRRDGEVNPVTQGEGTDKVNRGRFFAALDDLAFAYWITNEPAFALRADTLLRTWFIDTTARMAPHLDFAQGVPGRTTGRCYGIIEFLGLVDLVTSLQLLEQAGGLPAATKTGLQSWMAAYVEWLRTSDLGREEATRHNNHATWYDAQELSLLLYLGQREAAVEVAERVKERIDEQIAADGSQPEELARTKTLSYSTMNLRGFTKLARMAERVGVDLWSYETDTGAGIRRAYDFLLPYANGSRQWKYPQLGDIGHAMEQTRALFRYAGTVFDVPSYCSAGATGAAAKNVDDLLYDCAGVTD